MNKVLLLILLLAGITISCISSKKSNATLKEEQYEIIYQDYYKGFSKKSYRLIKSYDDYKGIFISLKEEKIPYVNFEKSNVLVLNMGKKPASGFAIYPTKIIEDKGRLIVLLKEATPKKGDIVSMTPTNPITVVKINSKKDLILK